MYKLLLCIRYLRTRYIALASIISVTLGVATMIVVNSVMAGFANEMQTRIHSFLADLVVDSTGLDGFPNADWHMRQIRRIAGDDIGSMTATVHVPAMLTFEVNGRSITRAVNLIGIDEATYGNVSDFAAYLQHPENRKQLSFLLREGGYDILDHQDKDATAVREEMKLAGWRWRRMKATANRRPVGLESYDLDDESRDDQTRDDEIEDSDDESADDALVSRNVFEDRGWRDENAGTVFDPAHDQHSGVVLGIALTNYRRRGDDGKLVNGYLLRPGDDVQLTFPSSGARPTGMTDQFTVVDYYESKFFEYDSSVVFVPMKKLQQLRGMIEPSSGVRFVSSIRIKLAEGADGRAVRDKLRDATLDSRTLFPPSYYTINTWRDKQGPLLEAVQTETGILNILLFMIIAVAGFGILATFFMIVVEKTKDIGILKSLGASATGVMGIFLAYGLSLGIVGAGTGMGIGLLFVRYINEIRLVIERISGREVFNQEIYYFREIPTIINPATVAGVVAGAIAIAVLASVLPALRAALLHPVEALRA